MSWVAWIRKGLRGSPWKACAKSAVRISAFDRLQEYLNNNYETTECLSGVVLKEGILPYGPTNIPVNEFPEGEWHTW